MTHFIPDEELKRLIIRRFYNINKQRTFDSTEFMDKLSNGQFSHFTHGAVLSDMLLMPVVTKMKRKIDAAVLNDNLSEEELKHLERRNTLLDKQLKRVAHLSKVARDKVKFDILTQIALREDADPVQLKQTQTPGQVDWDDDSWLEGDPGKANESD